MKSRPVVDAAPGEPLRKDKARARRDAAATRDALLGAAIAEFSRNGYAGARVDKIAALAGVNKQLVYHYHGSKDGLYLAALEHVYAALREKERRLSLDTLDAVDAMAKLIGISFDHLAEHPELIAMLTDENRHEGRHVKESQPLRAMHTPLVELIEKTLHRGVAAGVFRDDYDAVDLYISIAGISYFYFSNNHTLSTIFGKRMDTPAARAQRRRHVVAFAMNALRPDAAPGA